MKKKKRNVSCIEWISYENIRYVEESLITMAKSIRRARSQIVPSIVVHHREILSEKTFFLSTFFVLYSCFYFASIFLLLLVILVPRPHSILPAAAFKAVIILFLNISCISRDWSGIGIGNFYGNAFSPFIHPPPSLSSCFNVSKSHRVSYLHTWPCAFPECRHAW